MRISDWSSDVCSSDLGTARNLAVAVLPRQPDFEVIGLARGKAHVAAAQQHLAVRQFERLEDLFGGARLAFELGVAVLGTDDRDELDLPELVLAAIAALVAPPRPGFGPAHGGERGLGDRQVGLGAAA